jgi:hypothetical protein
MIAFLNNIKEIAIIASIVFGLGASAGWWRQKQKSDDLANNLYAKTVQYEDEKGRRVTETTELRFTVDELQNVAAKDSAIYYASMSDMEKRLWEVGQEAEVLKADKDKLISYHKSEVEAIYKDLEVIPTIKDNKLVSIEPIETKHLQIRFNIEGDKITADAKYNTNITTIVDRNRDQFTKKGKKRFFIAKWIKPRWQYSDKTVCEDVNATIKNTVSINFENRK